MGRWLVEPDLNLLQADGRDVPIEPRLMSLLLFLAKQPGQVALKEDILLSVWNGVSATDESLSQAVSKLRRILGDDPEQPTYIETIRKKGYRLLAPVNAPDDPTQSGPRYKTYFAATLGGVAMVAAFLLMQAPETTVRNPVLNSQPITSKPGRERDPGISADGQYVVYSAHQVGGQEQIYLHGIGRGTEDRQLTRKGRNRAAVFFPDNERIAFQRVDDSSCTIILMTLVDGAERVLGDCTGSGYSDTAISPDGRSIAFNGRESESDSHAIYLMDVDTGYRTAATSPPAHIWGDFDPVFSADSEKLVFARSISEGMQDVYAINLRSGREQQLTNQGRNIFGVAIIDDRALYGTNRNGRYEIWSTDLDGQDSYHLPVTSSGLVNPSISQDGSRMVFEVIDRAVALTDLDLERTDGSRLVHTSNADILHPDISSATQRVAFSSNRSGHYEIWDSDESGTDLRRLTEFASGFTAHPQFSPDGGQIAFDARPDGNSRIYLMNQDGSNLRAVTREGRNAFAPTWSPDGKSLYYSAESGELLQIWRRSLETSEPTQVTTEGGLFARVGSDNHLYHIRPGRDGIWRTATDDGSSPERVLSSVGVADWGNWALRGQRILFYDRDANTLRSYELNSETFVNLAQVPGAVPTADPSVAFNMTGTRAYIGIRTKLDSDLEIVTGPLKP